MPIEVQYKMIRSIKGLENAEILKPGYAIEYNYIDPRELFHTLETKKLKGYILPVKLMELLDMKKQQDRELLLELMQHFLQLERKEDLFFIAQTRISV